MTLSFRHPWPDAVLAVVLAGAALVELGTGISGALDPGAPPVTGGHYLLALLLTLPFALRSRAPVPVGLGVQAVAASSLLVLAPVEVLAESVAVFFVATYTAATGAPTWRASVLAGFGSATLLAVYGALDPRYGALGSAIANVVFTALAWTVAAVVRRYRELADTAERLAAAQAELAVEAERRRVARELHDVVAHGLSVIVLRARGAVHDLAADPATAEPALRDIDRVASRALTDMRSLLQVTGGGAGSTPGPAALLGPQPILTDLPDLVRDVRESGLPVDLTVTGAARPMTAGTELAAYRVVQESLTNVVRHAGARHAVVRLDWRSDELVVVVRDDGRGDHEQPAGAGRGLTGMRERVELVGGRLHCGPAAGGGFRVEAVLPVQS